MHARRLLAQLNASGQHSLSVRLDGQQLTRLPIPVTVEPAACCARCTVLASQTQVCPGGSSCSQSCQSCTVPCSAASTPCQPQLHGARSPERLHSCWAQPWRLRLSSRVPAQPGSCSHSPVALRMACDGCRSGPWWLHASRDSGQAAAQQVNASPMHCWARADAQRLRCSMCAGPRRRAGPAVRLPAAGRVGQRLPGRQPGADGAGWWPRSAPSVGDPGPCRWVSPLLGAL